MAMTTHRRAGLLSVFACLLFATVACGTEGTAGTPAQSPTPSPVPVPVLSEEKLELVNTQRWLNSEPTTIPELTGNGQVVLVDFWTYTCINCINTFPALRAWHDRYKEHGLTVLGVHTPEFRFEQEYSNLSEAVLERDLQYPIVQDNQYSTWRAFKNRYWPATYLIDSSGRLRHTHFGEGGYLETEEIIRSLLAEAGKDLTGITPIYDDA